jgi:uncharacterized protein YjbI with pentapeptide repeats
VAERSAPEAVAAEAPRLAAELEPAGPEAVEDFEEWRSLLVEGLDLTGIDAEDASVFGSRLRAIRTVAADLTGLTMTDVEVVDSDWSAAQMGHSSWLRVQWRECRLGEMVASDSKLRHIRFEGCRLDEANLRFSKLEAVEFVDCSMAGTDLTGANGEGILLAGCDLRGAVMHKARLAGTRIERCRLEGLKGATALKGAQIDAEAVLPMGLALMAELSIRISD